MDDFSTGFLVGQDSCNNSQNGGNGMWGGDGSWIFAFLIIALIFGDRLGLGGNGNNGGSNGGGSDMAAFIPYLAGSVNANGAVTRADLCSEFNFNDLHNSVRGIAGDLATGFANLNSTICHQEYETAGLINGLGQTVQNGFNTTQVAMMQNQNALQSQIAQCCCNMERAIDGVNYNMATNTCAITNAMNTNTRDIIENQNAGVRSILDYLCQEKIADLQNENQALRLSASQSAQNQYLISQLRPSPNPAFIVPNPFTGAYGYQGYGNGCCGGCC